MAGPMSLVKLADPAPAGMNRRWTDRLTTLKGRPRWSGDELIQDVTQMNTNVQTPRGGDEPLEMWNPWGGRQQTP